MRARWIVLTVVAGSALVALTVASTNSPIGVPWLDLAGLVVAAGLGLWASIGAYPRRWPAAVALIAVAPLVMDLVDQTMPNRGAMSLLQLILLYAVGGVAVAALTALLTSTPGQADRLPVARTSSARSRST